MCIYFPQFKFLIRPYVPCAHPPPTPLNTQQTMRQAPQSQEPTANQKISQEQREREKLWNTLRLRVEGAPEQAERWATSDEQQSKSRSTSDGAGDMTDRRYPMPESQCDVHWTGARAVLVDRTLMQRCLIRLLACVAALAALLCWHFCLLVCFCVIWFSDLRFLF